MASAAATPAPSPPGVTAYDADGQRLPPNPALQKGQPVTVVVTGFAPRAAVTVVDVNTLGRREVRANVHGTATVRYLVPRVVNVRRGGLLEFVGVIATHVAPDTVDAAAGAHVAATIPLLRRFPYRLGTPGGGHGVGGTHTGTSGGGLASTGLDALALLALAALLLVGGAVVLRTGRRRRQG